MSTLADPELPRSLFAWLLRFATATALSAVGFAAIVGITSIAGCGHDLHALRVAVTVGVLFVAMLGVLSARRSTLLRITSLALAVIVAPLAWWLVPCNFSGGSSLLDAVIHSVALKGKLRGVISYAIAQSPSTFDEFAVDWRETIARLGADYPSISVSVQQAFDKFLASEVHSRVAELRKLSATDLSGFRKLSPIRKGLARNVPLARQQLIDAEEEWARRWARFTAVSFTEADMSPSFKRQGCGDAARQLLAFPSVDESPERFLEARRVFFHAAQEIAEQQIRDLQQEQLFSRAFGVALSHQLEWTSLPGVVTPEEQKELAALHERCRALQPPGGDPELVPPPRPVETAPPPRVKE